MQNRIADTVRIRDRRRSAVSGCRAERRWVGAPACPPVPETSGNLTLTPDDGLWTLRPSCFSREKADGTESAVLQGARGTQPKNQTGMMKTIAYLTLVGGLALVCAGAAFAGPIGDDEGGGGVSESFTPPPAPPPPLGQEVSDYINSLPPDSGDRGTAVSYDTSGYMPKSTDGLTDLQISWNDIVGVTTGAYDQYWLTHTAPPPQPLLQQRHRFFDAPTGNLGESDAAGEGYMFSVTARNIKFLAPIPEPTPLWLVGIGIAALALARRWHTSR
jgi:hypothetical protein